MLGEKNLAIIRYGQKAPLDNWIDRLERLTEANFRVDIAIATECDKGTMYLSPASFGQETRNCFPFLFSPIAVNIRSNQPSGILEGTYRTVIYNTLHHAKKRAHLEIHPNAGSFVESITEILKFVDLCVIGKIESSKLRVEVYGNISEISLVQSLKGKIKRYIEEKLGILQISKDEIKTYILIMNRLMSNVCSRMSRSTFSNLLTQFRLQSFPKRVGLGN